MNNHCENVGHVQSIPLPQKSIELLREGLLLEGHRGPTRSSFLFLRAAKRSIRNFEAGSPIAARRSISSSILSISVSRCHVTHAEYAVHAAAIADIRATTFYFILALPTFSASMSMSAYAFPRKVPPFGVGVVAATRLARVTAAVKILNQLCVSKNLMISSIVLFLVF